MSGTDPTRGRKGEHRPEKPATRANTMPAESSKKPASRTTSADPGSSKDMLRRATTQQEHTKSTEASRGRESKKPATVAGSSSRTSSTSSISDASTVTVVDRSQSQSPPQPIKGNPNSRVQRLYRWIDFKELKKSSTEEMRFLENKKFTTEDLRKAAIHAYIVADEAVKKNNRMVAEIVAENGGDFTPECGVLDFVEEEDKKNIMPVEQMPAIFRQLTDLEKIPEFKRTIAVLAKVFYSVNQQNVKRETEEKQLDALITWIDNEDHSLHHGNSESIFLNNSRFPGPVLQKAALYLFEVGKEQKRSFNELCGVVNRNVDRALKKKKDEAEAKRREARAKKGGADEKLADAEARKAEAEVKKAEVKAKEMLAKIPSFEKLTSPAPLKDFWTLEDDDMRKLVVTDKNMSEVKKSIALMAKQLRDVQNAEYDMDKMPSETRRL